MKKFVNWFWIVAGSLGIIYNLPKFGDANTSVEALLNVLILGAIVAYNYNKLPKPDKKLSLK